MTDVLYLEPYRREHRSESSGESGEDVRRGEVGTYDTQKYIIVSSQVGRRVSLLKKERPF